MGTFDARITELQHHVGDGDLEARVAYDQVYAWNQHEGGWLNFLGKYGPKAITRHPHGGHGHFLTQGLTDSSIESYQRLAEHVLDDEPGSLIRAMASNAEQICRRSSDGAPIEWGDLRESDHPTVVDNGEIVYDRPPAVERLSEGALREKGRHSPWTGSAERTYLPEGSARYGTVHPFHGGPILPKPEPTVDHRSERVHDDEDLLRHWQDQVRRSVNRHVSSQHEAEPDRRSDPARQLDKFLRRERRAAIAGEAERMRQWSEEHKGKRPGIWPPDRP